MINGKLAVGVLVAVCAFSLTGEASARGGAGGGRGMGIRAQKRDGSCIRNITATRTQTRQQLRDGSGVGADTARRGTGQGAKRRLGPGDGTGNAVRPQNGTGYGSPLK